MLTDGQLIKESSRMASNTVKDFTNGQTELGMTVILKKTAKMVLALIILATEMNIP